MSTPWYERPMRIAALQCNFEDGETLQVIDKWLRSGFNVEQVFHPMADAYSALFDHRKHAALLSAYVRKAKEQGLRLIVYMNVHILGPSLAGQRDAWAQRAADGSYPKLYDTYDACCVNSPWREFYLSALKDVAAYDIDGVFLDGPTLIPGGCHCVSCQERYRREEGSELAQATPHERYGFYQRSLRDFLAESYRRFKQYKPQGIHYQNLPVMHASASTMALAEVLPYNDLVGTEGGFMFYGPPKEGYLWRPSLAAKVLEGVEPTKPRVIFMAADQKPWSWYPHTPSETTLCIASSVANGANVWYGLHGASTLLETPSGQAAARLMRFMEAHEEVYTAAESVARVAVLFSLDTERAGGTAPGARTESSDFYGQHKSEASSLGDPTLALQGSCDMLARSSIPYDVITELSLSPERLARYDVLLLPTSACLSTETCEALRRFVQAGGTLVSTLDTSLYDEKGAPRGDFGLADVLGVTYRQGATHYRTHNYVSPSGPHALFEGLANPLWPAPEVGLEVQARAGAQVLARFHGVMAGRYVPLTSPEKPAIVWNRFGQGQSLYLGGSFAEFCATYSPPEYRRLLQNVVRLYAQPSVTLGGASGNVEMVVRRQDQRRIVHLVNYAGLPPRPFEAVAAQRGLVLRVADTWPITQVRALVADVACIIRREDAAFEVDLPELQAYEVLVLD